MCVANDISQGFLRDAKTGCLEVTREALVLVQLSKKIGPNPSPSRLPINVPTQSRDQAQVIQLRRTQINREIAHLLERLIDYVDIVFNISRCFGSTTQALHDLQIDLNSR